MSSYEEQMRKGLSELGRQQEIAVFYGPQPTELAEFPGGECPSCQGQGSDSGGPSPWTCRTCAGSGKLGHVWLKRYLPYPDTHPNHGTKWERTGWAT